MRLELEHTYDRELLNKRLSQYQQLFHISRTIPREFRSHEVPSSDDLRGFREDFHNWYFNEEAGGLFLTSAAKDRYFLLQNGLEDAAKRHSSTGGSVPPPLSPDEQETLYRLASNLRNQLAMDVGTAQPPRVRLIGPGTTIPPPARS